MNSITFYFSQGIPLALTAMLTAAALLYAALNVSRRARLAGACSLAWAGFACLAVCMVAWFKGQAFGLDTAPRRVQWQLGALLAAGALLARVSLLRAHELLVAQGYTAVRLGRIVRWQLIVAALLLGAVAWMAWLR
jgi:hypothetical protein